MAGSNNHYCVPFCTGDSRYLNKKTKTDPGQDNFKRISK